MVGSAVCLCNLVNTAIMVLVVSIVMYALKAGSGTLHKMCFIWSVLNIPEV